MDIEFVGMTRESASWHLVCVFPNLRIYFFHDGGWGDLAELNSWLSSRTGEMPQETFKTLRRH